MNYTPPTYTPDTKAIGPWFLLAPPKVDFAEPLIPSRFVRFDYSLDFAGFSARGIALSVKRSAGPAKIGPYPLLACLPDGFVPFISPVKSNLLLRTDRPRLAFINLLPHGSPYRFCSALGVHHDDLADIVEIVDAANRKRLANEVPIQDLTPEIVKLLIQYPNHLKLVFFKNMVCVRIHANLRLLVNQWWALSRHIFTGRVAGTFDETTSVVEEESKMRGIKLQGHSFPQVIDRWGISAVRPHGYDGTHLLFRELRVDDAAKLACRYPQVRLLQARVLRVPKESDGLAMFPLHHAAAAGVIPPTGNVLVNFNLEEVFLPEDKVGVGRLKCPLPFRSPTGRLSVGLLCPEHLVGNYLISAAVAAKNYQIDATVRKYSVVTHGTVAEQERCLSGSYYYLADVTARPRRDLRLERRQRAARSERLRNYYGPNFPRNYARFNDEQLEAHLRIDELRARGEVVDASDHPALPHSRYRQYYSQFAAWLQKAKPDVVMRDPITQRSYVQASLRVEDLACLPGFWAAVDSTLGDSCWLRSLILCPQVRAAALAHAI